VGHRSFREFNLAQPSIVAARVPAFFWGVDIPKSAPPAGHFERVHVNADRVENGAEGFSDIEHVANKGMELLGKAT
jgi:hypothetical protein